MRSPRCSAANSVAGAPPRSESAPVVTAGTAGRSSTPTRSTRPAEVTSPTVPRVVERASDTTTSWRLRPVRRRPLVSSGIGVQRRAGEQPGARQHDVAGLVQDLGGRRPGGDQRLEVAADEHRPPGRPCSAATSASSSAITPRSSTGSASSDSR
jgi:hypothetical protein